MIARTSQRNQTTAIPMATLVHGSPSGHALNRTNASPPTAPMRAPTRAPFHCTEARATAPFSGMPRACSGRVAGHNRRMDLSSDPDEATHQLAAARAGDPTAWFDDLYRAAGSGAAVVPWDTRAPNPLLVEWVDREGPPTRPGPSSSGAGYGRDAEYLASLGYPTTAFDISPAAVEQTRTRFPDSAVTYDVADLLALPRGGSARSTSSSRA